MSTVTMKQLLEAGVHFGHQTKRWNPPKMKENISAPETGFTSSIFKRRVPAFLRSLQVRGRHLHQGGTDPLVERRNRPDSILEEATRAGCSSSTQRMAGGTLTNFRPSEDIDHMKKLKK